METGVSKDIAGMVLPLGATMHMDGSCFSCVLKIAFVPVSYTHLDVYKRQGFHPHFNLLMRRSPGFGSMATNFMRPIQTRSRYASGTEYLKLCLLYTSRCV